MVPSMEEDELEETRRELFRELAYIEAAKRANHGQLSHDMTDWRDQVTLELFAVSAQISGADAYVPTNEGDRETDL